jgi:hypothetical protein
MVTGPYRRFGHGEITDGLDCKALEDTDHSRLWALLITVRKYGKPIAIPNRRNSWITTYSPKSKTDCDGGGGDGDGGGEAFNITDG